MCIGPLPKVLNAYVECGVFLGVEVLGPLLLLLLLLLLLVPLLPLQSAQLIRTVARGQVIFAACKPTGGQ